MGGLWCVRSSSDSRDDPVKVCVVVGLVVVLVVEPVVEIKLLVWVVDGV